METCGSGMRQGNVFTVQDTLSDQEACWEFKVGFTFLQINRTPETEIIKTKR